MGAIVMGKVESGSVCKGSQFIMMPNQVKSRFVPTPLINCNYNRH